MATGLPAASREELLTFTRDYGALLGAAEFRAGIQRRLPARRLSSAYEAYGREVTVPPRVARQYAATLAVLADAGAADSERTAAAEALSAAVRAASDADVRPGG